VTGAVQSATLRLFATNGSSNGPSLYLTDNTWSETGITWNNRPAPTGGAVANVGAVAGNTWAEFNVTAQVTGNGTYNFVLLPDSTDGMTLTSREGTLANRPQLVLTFTSGPTPTPTNTPTPGPSPTPTNTPTPTSTPIVTGLTLAAAADARVLQSNPTTNYGTLNRLDVDSPGQESYLRFTVSGVTGPIQSATLRLFATNGSTNGPSLYFTDNSWTETGITWDNRPAPTSGAVANFGAITSSTWAEIDVTALITGNGTYNFVLLPDSTDGATMYSRERTATPPQLVLTFP
jgi:hypothetical protein